jgi:hypothetical protein
MPSKKPTTRVRKPARGKKPSRVTKVLGPRLTVAVVVGVLAGGMLIAARQQSHSTDMMSATLRAETLTAVPTTGKRDDASGAPLVATVEAEAVTKAPAVTITGCLERSDETFRLKDTTGADAPKARSWKSGFLKKGSASIAVVDATHTFKLADYVGRRVTVTGTLVDREMQVRSLRRVAPTCGQVSAH